jgi:hypothetical protein
MKITIKNVKNANELDGFQPVEGEWQFDNMLSDLEDRDLSAVETAVSNYMDAKYKIKVQLFHTNGHEITGDIPSGGLFLATRI